MNSHTQSPNSNLRRLLTGLAAGDSLGSTSEFVPRSSIPDVYRANPEWPFKQVGGGTFEWEPGAATDDTDMAMCIVRAIRDGQLPEGSLVLIMDPLECDCTKIAENFVAWWRGRPRDIGMTTQSALVNIAKGTSWDKGGYNLWKQNPRGWANGSLMRNGVVPGLVNTLGDAFQLTLCHGMMTHYAPLPQLCCALQTWIIWKTLRGLNVTHDAGINLKAFREELNGHLPKDWYDTIVDDYNAAWEILGSADFSDKFNPFTESFSGRQGYCLLTLQIGVWALRWAMREEPFDAVPEGFPKKPFDKHHTGPWVLAWVAMIGYDSDTYGATAGPMIAAYKAIPVELTHGLKALTEYAASRP